MRCIIARYTPDLKQVDDLHSDIFRKGKSEDLRGDYNEAKDYNPHPFVDPH